MSLSLPKSTELNRFVAKTNFYKRPGMTPKLRTLIEQQVDRLTWSHKVSPKTMAISTGDIEEFQIFNISLKTTELDNSVLVFLQKAVSYPLIFTIQGGGGVRISAVITETKQPLVLSTEWRSTDSLELKGNSTDIIYKNYLFQISSGLAAVNGDSQKHVEAAKLKRSIDALTAKIRRETQVNKRQELARERYSLETELKEILG